MSAATDLASLFDEIVAAVAPRMEAGFPGFPVLWKAHGNDQLSEGKDVSRISRIFRGREGGSQDLGEEISPAGASGRVGVRAKRGIVEQREMREQREIPAVADTYISRSLSLKREIERETGNPRPLPGAFTHQLALASDPVAQLAFDERAAFLEYECGLSRAEAERQAAAEIIPETTAPTCNDPAPAVGSALKAWSLGFGSLDPNHAPCPDYRGDEWSRVHANALAFLNTFGAQAEALGWETHELFGVHPEVGTGRPDHCGALVLTSGGTVRAITADTIRFDRATYRRAPGQSRGTPIWEVRR